MSLEVRARDYVRLLWRGPRSAWRPVLSLLLLGVVWLAFFMIVLGLSEGWCALTGVSCASLQEDVPGVDDFTVLTLLAIGGALGMGVPAVVLATRWGHGVPSGVCHSVEGRFRWSWFARCMGAATGVQALALVAAYIAEGRPDLDVHPRLWVLLVAAVLIFPWQSAGEEYVFRGWILQNVGALVPWRSASLVVATLVSACLFAVMHGSMDPWVLATLATTAVCMCVLVWRTGGLEAAVAAHAANNVIVTVEHLLLGSLEDAAITEATTIKPLEAGAYMLLDVAVLLVLLTLARRQGVATAATVRPGTVRA